MKKLNTRNYLIPLPLILVAIIFITDTIIGAAGIIIKEVMLLREIAFFLISWFIISRIKLFKTPNIISLTRNLFIFLVAILFTHVLTTWLLTGEAARFAILLKPFSGFIVGSILSFLQLIFALVVLTVSRDIIYLRRRKSTQRNFNLFHFAMLGFILYRIYVYYQGAVEISIGINLESLFTGTLIFFIVVNSFRNSWINYLNKSQKLRYLLLSLFLAIIPSVIYQEFFTEFPPYSIFIHYLQLSIGIFVIIYWSLAFVSLLFHLPTAGIVDRKMKEIHSLHTLSQTFSSEFDFNRLVIKITQLSTEVTEANGAWLEILHADTGRLELIASKNVPKSAIQWIDAHPEQNVGQHVVQLRDAVWINDARKNEKTNALKKRGLNVGSLMAVPILSYDKILGVLYIFKALEYDFIPDDLNMLKTFADQAAVALENARLVKENIERERFAEELRIAHDAQMKLLPKTMPQMKGLEMEAICITANNVGGDYYDFFQFSPHQLGMVIGDVSGKGAEAAFYMAEVKGIIESLARADIKPRDVLIRANSLLRESFETNYFITMIYGILDLKKKKFTFSRAGHCPLLHHQAKTGKSQFIEPAGIGIGMVDDPIFGDQIEEKTVSLAPGDVLFLFTDGIVEAMNDEKEQYSEERLLAQIEKTGDMPAGEISINLMNSVKKFVGKPKSHDDLTMIVTKIQV